MNSALSTCWPPQATVWWNQDTAARTTVLAPSFVCPSAYHEVFTSSVDTYTTQTFCCPASYNLYNVEFDRPSFPSQCVSTLTEGQVLSYITVGVLASGSSINSATSTTVDGDVITIYGIPVNGLNVVSFTSASATTSTNTGIVTISTAADGEIVTVTTSASGSSTQSAPPSQSGPKSALGVAVGASIGAASGILLLVAGIFVLWRKRRRNLGYEPWERSAPPHEMDASLSVPKKSVMASIVAPSSDMTSESAVELVSNKQYVAYELPD